MEGPCPHMDHGHKSRYLSYLVEKVNNNKQYYFIIFLGIKTSLYLWSRCDVPFDGILPEKCINYDNDDCLEMMVFRFD